MKDLLTKISLGEKMSGAYEARTRKDIEEIEYLYSLGYVNKFDFINGYAATLTTKGSQELKRLQNA